MTLGETIGHINTLSPPTGKEHTGCIVKKWMVVSHILLELREE